MPGLHIATHPLIANKMTKLRDRTTNAQDFRRLLKEITFYLGYEASRLMATSPHVITTPMNVPFEGSKLHENVSIIPILRAGLGMSDGMLELLPKASVHHIGMFRSKSSLLPIQYYNRLPKDEVCDIAFITDPCIATSNTIRAVVSIIKRWGAKKIVVIATIGARAGIDMLLEAHPDIDVFIGQVDEVLSVEGMITPGIGDAGDRLFGTPCDEMIEYEAGEADKKRKRGESGGDGGESVATEDEKGGKK